MSYEITITETREIKKVAGKDWVKVGQRARLLDARFFTADEYGYSPEIEKTVTEKREIFKQTVDVLDFAKVIRAINNIHIRLLGSGLL